MDCDTCTTTTTQTRTAMDSKPPKFPRTSSTYAGPDSFRSAAFARTSSACTILSSSSFNDHTTTNTNNRIKSATPKRTGFSPNTSQVTLCEEEENEITVAFDLKSFRVTESSPSVPQTQPVVEKNSMVWNKAGRRVILDDHFEQRVEREAHLRMSLDSESCALIQLHSKHNLFPRNASRRNEAQPIVSRTTSKNRNSFITSCFMGSTDDDDVLNGGDFEDELPNQSLPQPESCRNTTSKRERIAKMWQDTREIAIKIVAVPAIIIFDIAGNIFG